MPPPPTTRRKRCSCRGRCATCFRERVRARLRRFSERPDEILGAEIFSAGTHRGKTYTIADLDQMVRNFRRFSTDAGNPGRRVLLEVPAVLGHREDQEDLQKEGLPAAAWCRRLYRQGQILKADFGDVPPEVQRLIEGRRYKHVSAEVYDSIPAGLPGASTPSKVLRRVAFLGADIPQVKGLKSIPVPQAHAERGRRWHPVVLTLRECRACPRAGTFISFSEVTMADRNEMIQQLGDMGVDTSTIDDQTPDPVLAEWIRTLDASQNPGGDDDVTDHADPPSPDESPAVAAVGNHDNMDDNDGDNDGAQPPPPPTDKMSACKYMAYARKMAAKYDANDDLETSPASNPNGSQMSDKPRQFSEKQIAGIVQKAVARALKGKVEKSIGELSKFAEEQIASQKKAAVDTFLEAKRTEGKVLPRELDPTNPANLRDRLLRADSRAVVSKFTEKGKKLELTELDLQMREIDQRQPFKFGERIAGGKGGVAGTGTDEEVARVEKFAEDPDFSKALSAAGKTPADFVEGFKKARKEKPGLTARQYGVPEHVAA